MNHMQHKQLDELARGMGVALGRVRVHLPDVSYMKAAEVLMDVDQYFVSHEDVDPDDERIVVFHERMQTLFDCQDRFVTGWAKIEDSGLSPMIQDWYMLRVKYHCTVFEDYLEYRRAQTKRHATESFMTTTW